ncbi:50S ribosomal protein L3 [Ureaplasma miroungigenitalium]|uniref:Large ribosomal subunit protein uL3 n=1 Tax=Ureaplasma miroungigenitalium TaxID=1042321 RepID=A0ABT3BN07_9BACT|nr:50S ribosomal protein L3 [Ureaplasma miroungigenitalium]MCV3728412.1 50S ribosomal protein L3 [Ureaplasma miroungigenitalium]MCV3734199.1 50S ribosomal protein L3 [Ureaplasma miroungigenitalium]
MKSLLGTKVGMTQVFSEDGQAFAATVVYVEPNEVLAVRTKENDGYDAVQVGYHTVKEKALNKPQLGLFNKLNVEPKRYVKELRDVAGNVGDKLDVNTFAANELVNVQAITKGHGFTGSIKRHNYSMGPMGHGAGYPHRYVGSIACGRGGSQAQRVFKGTKLPGHYGHELVTIKNLLVLDVRPEENLILIKGAIPGPKGSLVTIKSGTKENKASPIAIVNYSKTNQTQAEK